MEYRLGDLYEVSNGLSKSGEFFGTGYPFLTFSTVFNKSKISSLIAYPPYNTIITKKRLIKNLFFKIFN